MRATFVAYDSNVGRRVGIHFQAQLLALSCFNYTLKVSFSEDPMHAAAERLYFVTLLWRLEHLKKELSLISSSFSDAHLLLLL